LHIQTKWIYAVKEDKPVDKQFYTTARNKRASNFFPK